METLRKVAQILASHGQKDLAREAAEISLQVKKTAASEVELKDLDADVQKFARSMEASFGKIENVWEGVHGIIVEYAGRSERVSKETLQKLMAYDGFRWLEISRGSITVGM